MKKIFYTLLIVLFLVPVITHAETKKLYDVFKEEAESGSGLVHEYTGEHKDSFTKEGTKKIYHWYGEQYDIDNENAVKDKWNVLFGNHCWQMYRTTDTGGVRLIYNGEYNEYEKIPLSQNQYSIVANTAGFTWNSETSSWNLEVTSSTSSQEWEYISFTIPNIEGYSLYLTGPQTESSEVCYALYINNQLVDWYDSGGTEQLDYSYILDNISSSDIIKFAIEDNYSGNGHTNLHLQIAKKGEVVGTSCDNHSSKQTIGKSAYNINSNSPAYVGYKYGTVYEVTHEHKNKTDTGWKYAPDYEYSNGIYTLKSKKINGITYDIQDDLSHNLDKGVYRYSCGNSTDTTCESIKYIVSFWRGMNDYDKYYISLYDGKRIGDAMNEMITNSSNTTDSTIKAVIDAWYQNNMMEYTSKLEDTIFCNDRDFENYTNLETEWNPESDLFRTIKFKSYSYNNTNTTDLSCTNKTDQFSMSNDKAQLEYPIGLMNATEVTLLGNNGITYRGNDYWLLSPSHSSERSYSKEVDPMMGFAESNEVSKAYDVRPVISLKPGSTFSSGDGSISNPYVIDWNYSNIEIEGEEEFIELSELENIKEGTEVVFHIISADGLIEIKIIDEEGNQIEYESTDNENEYKFVMPNSNVTIKPIFKEKLPDIVNPQTGTLLFFALMIVMLLEIGTYHLIQIKKKRMKEFE